MGLNNFLLLGERMYNKVPLLCAIPPVLGYQTIFFSFLLPLRIFLFLLCALFPEITVLLTREEQKKIGPLHFV